MPEALLTAPASLEGMSAAESHAERVAMRDQQQQWYAVRLPALAAAMERLPEGDRELLWALRCGRRSWRLDLADWSKLARALTSPSRVIAAANALVDPTKGVQFFFVSFLFGAASSRGRVDSDPFSSTLVAVQLRVHFRSMDSCDSGARYSYGASICSELQAGYR